MSKFKSKLARRIMALVLSGAMVMSNLSLTGAGTVYAAEENEPEIVSETEDNGTDAGNTEGGTGTEGTGTGTGTEGTGTGTEGTGTGTEGTGTGDETDPPASTVTVTVGKPSVTTTEDDNNVIFSWNAVTVKEGADEADKASEYTIKYTVSLMEKAENASEMLDSNSLEISNTFVSVAKTKFEAEKTYTFTVKATATKDDKSEDSEEASVEYTAPKDESGSGETKPSAPTNVQAKVNDAKDGVVVTWDAVSDATTYEVTATEQGEGATATVTKTASTNSVTFAFTGTDSLTRGKSYKFSVVAKKDNVESEPSADTAAVTVPNETVNPNPPQTGEKTTTVTFDAQEFTMGTNSPNFTNEKLNAKLGEQDTIAITGSVKEKVSNSINAIEIQPGTGNSVDITVKGTASITIKLGSTSNTATTKWALLKDGTPVEVSDYTANSNATYTPETDGYVSYSGGSGRQVEVIYNDLAAGTYNLATHSACTVGVRVYTMTIVDTVTTGDQPSVDRGNWDDVKAPEITEVTYDASKKDTKISVKVKGVIDKTGVGADQLTVAMYDTDIITAETAPIGTPQVIKTKTTADEEDNNHYTTVTFTPSKSGTYYFKATLERSVESDENYAPRSNTEANISEKKVDFKLPLKTPAITTAELKEDTTDTITVGWNAVNEASYYVIAMRYSDEANSATAIDSVRYIPTADESSATSFSKDITGLVAGSTIKVTVQAFRGNPEATEVADIDKSDVSGERTVTLEKVVIPEGTKVFEAKNLTSWSATANTYVNLTDDGYFKFMAKDSANLIFKSDDEIIFDDDYITSQLFKFGGKYESNKYKWIEFTTEGSAEIKVWWNEGSDAAGRSVALFDSEAPNTEVKVGTTSERKNASYIDTFSVSDAGTYRIAPSTSVGNNDVRIAKIEVKEGVKVNKQYTFNGATVYTADIAAGTYTDGQPVKYVNDYFTVLYSEKSKVEKKSYSGADAWSDGYGGGYRLNFGGTASKTMNAIKFTTTESEATVKVWWKAGDAGRHVQILNADGGLVEESKEVSKKDASYITKFKLTSAGTYYLGNAGGNNYLFKVNVEEGHVPDAVAWDTVAAPVIKSAVQEKGTDDKLTGNIVVTFAAYIDELNGCEKVTVDMYGEDPSTNTDAEILKTNSSSKTTEKADEEVSITLAPDASGTYYFVARASRAEETATHDSAVYAMTTPFSLPLKKPSITRATNDGKGGMEIAYSETAEADKYVATATQVTENEDGTYKPVEGAEVKTAESVVTTAKFEGLEIGKYYAFTVHAVRGEEPSDESEAFYKIVKNEEEQVWDFSAFGESTTTVQAQCGYSGDVNDGEASVWSLGGKGKIVPGSTDGVSFLYTKINKDTNFVLEATAVVDEWTFNNGQEGFGLMVSDTVGPHGHGTKFWNNSYMAAVTKMEYYWNGSTVLPATAGPADDRVRYNMYLGIGSIVRTGVTDEWEKEQAAGATIPSKFVTQSLSLEHAAASEGRPTGDYNVIANATKYKDKCVDVNPLTEIKLRIEKNNTGYFITYIDKNGEETTHKFYEGRTIVDKDYQNQSLLQIDKENIYVGLFAARYAKATFKDIKFTTSSVDDGGEPEERPQVVNSPSYTILSGSVSNTAEYDINFTTNWNGTLSIKDSAGRELVNEDYFKYAEKTMTTVLDGGSYKEISMLDKYFEYEKKEVTEKDDNGNDVTKSVVDVDTVRLKADVKVVVPINDDVNQASKLAIGNNQFTVSFTPDRAWHKNDDALQVLSSYDTSVQTLNVSYRQYGEEGTNLYVSPDGKASGDGTKDSPLDIYTAVKYVQAGQTIVLLEGTYSLKKVLNIERGIDGTAEKPIRMIAEPGTYDRTKPFEPSKVVIDFNGIVSGMTIAGDYWYFRGFDVTNSSDGNKGIQVSGSHNVLDQINTYKNGNTGIQISRYKGTDIDKSDDWPSYNTILNCTSYLNADSGHEDADGFAAKLTIGDGNVFDGCIGAYNADDGWDFFAKSETGPIGQVIIKNSIAFKNGYILLKDGKLDITGTETKAGNGNGFKMGGESIKGYHMVINSYAFYNKAKGIDSNSCPDIQAYNCISYNNKNYNIAFYTGVAKYTEYRAENLISFRTDDVDPTEVDKDGKTVSYVKDQLKPENGAGADNHYDGASNFYWDDSKNAAANGAGKTITKDSFKSVEYKGLATVSRNDDGTINLGDFLAFSDSVDKSSFVKLEESTNAAGAKIYKAVENATEIDLPGVGGQPSDADKAKPADKDTTGDIVKGDDEDLGSSDVWTDEELKQLDINGDTLKILMNLDYNAKGYYTDYTGVALKPAVRVAYGPNELSNKNYSVGYKNNVKAYELRPGDAGFDAKLAPTIVIKGKGNYAGEYNFYYVINKIDLASSKVVSADITTVATGKAQKITPVVTFKGKKLGENKDYKIARRYMKEPVMAEDGITPTGEFNEVSYNGSYETAGTYYIELEAIPDNKGQANFIGTKTIKVEVLSEADAKDKTPMSKVKVEKIPDQTYDGNAHEPKVTVTGLTERKESVDAEGNPVITGDYDVAYYDNTEIGIASVVLTGYGDYYGTKTVTFKTVAKPFNVKDYSIKVKGTFDGKTYEAETDEQYKSLEIPSTGSAITFGSVVVTVLGSNNGVSDKRLTEGVDYTVSYKGNNKAGSASIVVKGMGDFKGTMKRTFKITPFEINDTNITVEPIGDQVYVKGGVKPSVIVKIKSNGKVISPSNYAVSYKNNNALSVDKGPATVSIAGKNLLKGSLKDVQTFNIVAKDLRLTNIVADNVYYGTAKNAGDGIAYLTKLAVKDGNKTLSLGGDYTVTYYEEDGTPVLDYKTGELKFRKTVTINNEDGTTKEEEQLVSAKPLEKNSKIKYDGSNKTIYAVITGGKNKLYTGAAFATYKVVGKNDIKTAKITKITDIYTYNDGNVAAPKLEVKIQNRHLESGKYVKDTELTTLKLNEDYEIIDLKNNDKAGTCTITIKGIGYYSGTNKVSFKIDKKDLSAWNAYLTDVIAENITVEVDEADIKAGGKYAGAFTFDDIIITSLGEDGKPVLDDDGKPVTTKETSPLAKKASGKIYTVGTKTSGALTYGTDYTAENYTNNTIDASKIVFDEQGYYTQEATVTIKGVKKDSGMSYTGSKTIRFTIKVKKTPVPEQTA